MTHPPGRIYCLQQSADEYPHPGSLRIGDTDQDGKLTREEFPLIYEKQFRGKDRNRDGAITADEM
ncbi:MAG: hypothetical protein HN742_03495 [Lentisphaerae bacterium]|jgi:hypothetical protein|nr:hypothetical protein [Lentisphaerota bacterium]MBT4821215.1 hypothetical protein [Lentisphaerota bacterium]MBT5609673.1 hypothetical protein [Lentisphaerota bacterium]MBT7054797.1 hypothetical protein [Lentisphaerota bacterium]MBT7840906.1 hypothetical protein [Lentisphaerota bacterium]